MKQSIASHSHKCSAGQKGTSIASTLSSHGSSKKHLNMLWNIILEYWPVSKNKQTNLLATVSRRRLYLFSIVHGQSLSVSDKFTNNLTFICDWKHFPILSHGQDSNRTPGYICSFIFLWGRPVTVWKAEPFHSGRVYLIPTLGQQPYSIMGLCWDLSPTVSGYSSIPDNRDLWLLDDIPFFNVNIIKSKMIVTNAMQKG